MKRLITFISLIVILFIVYTLIENGFENNSLNIASYKTIKTKSEALTKKLANYDKKNTEDYESAVSNLKSSIRTYEDSKSKYEVIVEELAEVLKKDKDEQTTEEEIIEEVIYSDKEKYKVDFLLVTLGDYGEKEGVDVIYQLTTSSTTDPNSSTLNYFLSDLKFTVTGQYMDVANFISDLENDDKLNWEIRDFTMGSGASNGYSGVSANFTVKDVPIDSESYLSSSTVDSSSADPFADDSSNANNGQNESENNNTSTNVNDTSTNTVSNTETNDAGSSTNSTTNTVSNSSNT